MALQHVHASRMSVPSISLSLSLSLIFSLLLLRCNTCRQAVAHALQMIAGGNASEVNQVITIQKQRLRDWEEIEKSAQARVRSDEFKVSFFG
jgi:hypothetical protein